MDELAYTSRSSGRDIKGRPSPFFGMPAARFDGSWTDAGKQFDDGFLSTDMEMPAFLLQPSKLAVALNQTDFENISIAKQAVLLKENLKARLLNTCPGRTTSHSPSSSIGSVKRRSDSVASAGGSGRAPSSSKSGLPVYHAISSPRENTSDQMTTGGSRKSSRQR